MSKPFDQMEAAQQALNKGNPAAVEVKCESCDSTYRVQEYEGRMWCVRCQLHGKTFKAVRDQHRELSHLQSQMLRELGAQTSLIARLLEHVEKSTDIQRILGQSLLPLQDHLRDIKAGLAAPNPDRDCDPDPDPERCPRCCATEGGLCWDEDKDDNIIYRKKVHKGRKVNG